jgi:hypothetical protein
MDILENKTNKELYESLLAEMAKATNELKCSERDIKKAQGRLQFVLVAVNELINRTGD